MIGPCGFGLLLLEVGSRGRYAETKKSALLLFWGARVAALLAILETPTTDQYSIRC